MSTRENIRLIARASLVVGHRPVNIRRAVIGQKGGWKIRCVF